MGLQLEIENEKLATILSKSHQDDLLCFADVFGLWKKSGFPPYTWATIIDVLRADIVGDVRLANDLEQWVKDSA